MKHATVTSLAVILSFVVLVVAGCGGGGVRLAEVSGTVTVDGKPVKGLEVAFDPQGEGAGSSLGYTQADGKYELFYAGGKKGAAVGMHTVRVTAAETDEGPATIQIPAKYNTKSELTFDVAPGTNTYDIPITTN
ncbi:MAG: hypothetical protein JJ992_06570 [Planctomycetes bacterium]|nr:hypothetical protein [Planctomycetota bacterium]